MEFFRHNISRKDIENVEKILHAIFLTTGKSVAQFERDFSNYTRCKYTIGLTSCTAALQLSLEALNIGRGDEVITTPMSFVATANSIIQAGATPVFVDVEEETGNIDVANIKRAITKKTKAIMPVHLYGQMCDMVAMRKLADKYGLKIIEDAAHCIEGERDGIYPGKLGDTACFSFYATKSITCGEGGAVVTNSRKLSERLKNMRMHGLTKSAADRYDKKFQHWDMKIFGWKYNMDNIQAALLSNQLRLIDTLWLKRKDIYENYIDLLKTVDGVDFPKILSGVKHACHLFTIWVQDKDRDVIVKKLNNRGIPVQINYRPIHLMSYYRKKYGYKKGEFPVAERIGASTITLPLYPKFTKIEINRVVRGIREVLSKKGIM